MHIELHNPDDELQLFTSYMSHNSNIYYENNKDLQRLLYIYIYIYMLSQSSFVIKLNINMK